MFPARSSQENRLDWPGQLWRRALDGFADHRHLRRRIVFGQQAGRRGDHWCADEQMHEHRIEKREICLPTDIDGDTINSKEKIYKWLTFLF